jgi:PAS domain S-box-containing protein
MPDRRKSQQEATQRLAAQQAVARALGEASTLGEAAPGVLEAIGRTLGWSFGALWEVDERVNELRWVECWNGLGKQAERFQAATQRMTFSPRLGLPGRVWSSGEPAWIADVLDDENFPRTEQAVDSGLRAAAAFPVRGARGVVGVIEFFSPEPRALDPALLETMGAFASQLGTYIERTRAEEAAEESEALRSAMLDAALDCIIGMDHRGNVIEFNAAAERTFGYSRAEVMGREMAELIIPPTLREAHRTALASYLQTEEGRLFGQRLELTGMRSDGREFPVELTITRIPASRPPQFTGFVRDVTDRHEAERVQRHLAAVVASSTDAVVSTDAEGRIRTWNPGAERLYGHAAEEVTGLCVDLLAPDDRPEEGDALLEDIRSGRGLDQREAEHVRKDGTRIDVSISLSPISETGGRLDGASIIARDVTEQKRSAQARDFIATASAALDASLDPVQTMRTICRTAVPELCELCAIDLLDEHGTIAQATAEAVDPALARELEEMRARYPLHIGGDHPVARALRTRRPLVVGDLSAPEELERAVQSSEHRAYMQRAGYGSVAVVPLIARGRVLGAISLARVRSGRRYGPPDLALLEELAARAAMALDNSRSFAERTRIASTLQQSLLPAALPALEGAEVASLYRPAGDGTEVGGDFFDVIDTGGGYALVLGDVCGKGAEAAAVTSLIRYSIRAFLLHETCPPRVLELVNDAMLREDLDSRFATAATVWVASAGSSWRAQVCTAGHPRPLLIDAAGKVTLLGEPGTLLGVFEDLELEHFEVELAPGDTLVLYTDGLLDSQAPERVLSEEDVAQALRGWQAATPDEILSHLEQLAIESPGRPRDDLAVLVCRRQAEPAVLTGAARSSTVSA